MQTGGGVLAQLGWAQTRVTVPAECTAFRQRFLGVFLFSTSIQAHLYRGGGDNFVRGSARNTSEGKKFATPANPKAYTASHTPCTAKAPRFRKGEILPPSLTTKLSHEIIPARNPPPPPCNG